MQRGQIPYAFGQVRGRRDGVAPIHCLRLVARELHGEVIRAIVEKCMLGSRKADFVVRLTDGRILAIECKARTPQPIPSSDLITTRR